MGSESHRRDRLAYLERNVSIAIGFRRVSCEQRGQFEEDDANLPGGLLNTRGNSGIGNYEVII